MNHSNRLKAASLFGRIFFLLCVMTIILLVWRWENVVSLFAIESQSLQSNGAVSNAIRVITTPVRITSNDRVFNAMGTGRAQHSVQVYPSIAEEVMAIYFEAGDKVEKGDRLVQLDDREEKLDLKMAEVRLEEAKSLLIRFELAVKDGAVPQSEVDSARASVDVAQVELDQAKLALQERKIIAPISGIVGIPRIDPGDRVNANTLITSLDNRAIIQVDFEVPEELSAILHKGQTITAQTPAFPNQTFTGYIRALESRVDPENRTLLVRADIDNQNDQLRPGMSFETRLEIDGLEYPTIPEISLQWGREGSFVWIVRDKQAEKVPIRVVARTAGNVLVDGEVAGGEPVVVEGLQRLQPNSQVIVTRTSDIGDVENNESTINQ